LSDRTRWNSGLRDILRAIGFVQQFRQHTGQSEFIHNREKISAVERQIEIIVEATKRLPPEFTASHPEVPWHKMARMRDFLAHQYDKVDPYVLWQTVHEDLPPLAPDLARMIDDTEST